jgi:hypothetical protein
MNEKNIKQEEKIKCKNCGSTNFVDHDGNFAVCECGVYNKI